MSPQLPAGRWGALIGRLGDALADPAAFSILQDRLVRHAAELNGQLPELLLRTPYPEVALRSWLADKDLSHWIPQADGGTAAQGWQFETASWNRSRGAAVMEPWEIGSAHLDGGIDALLAEGMPQAVGIESLEAALLAVGLSLGCGPCATGNSCRAPMPRIVWCCSTRASGPWGLAHLPVWGCRWC